MKSLERYYDINQRIYTRLIDEVREYSLMTKPRHGEKVFDISDYGDLIEDLLNRIKSVESIVFEIINHKIRSKKDYITLYEALRKENIFSVEIRAHEFYMVNQLSPLFPLYGKCLQLLEEHNKKLEENGINLSETKAFLYKNEVVSLAYITFFDLIREHFNDDLKAAVSRYSEHYRSVIADLKAHHKTILTKHERVDALTLRLPISCCNNYDFTEIEIDNYLLTISKFLNNLRKNKTLKHIVGYVVGRSFFAEEYPSVSIILFFGKELKQHVQFNGVTKETINYWIKIYNKVTSAHNQVPYIDIEANFSLMSSELTIENLDYFVKKHSGPLALQGDVIRFKNAPKRKKYFSRSEKL